MCNESFQMYLKLVLYIVDEKTFFEILYRKMKI